MEKLSDKIKSLQSTVGVEYKKPDTKKVDNYITCLEESQDAIDYLVNERNLTIDTIKHFKLGYCPDKNAIVIPVYKHGELVNIRYRFLSSEQRYSQTSGCEIWLYNDDGIIESKKKGVITIVEGEFDLMSCWQAGIKSVISPTSGKDSFGLWIELLDNTPKVYIAYDNDVGGKESSKKIAFRLGEEKCREIVYPDGIKDANDYFKKYSKVDFVKLAINARPFYKYNFKGVLDIIEDIRSNHSKGLTLDNLPFVEFGKDWIMVLSGVSNVGKTSYVLNLADELTRRNIPTLILPFERGIGTVGKRFIQIKYNLDNNDFAVTTDEDWDKMKQDSLNLPLYFSLPKKNEFFDIIGKAKRIFDTQIVIIDHLDYLIRQSTNKSAEIGTFLQETKRVAEEFGIIFIIVHHLRKGQVDTEGKQRKPVMEDLKDSASLFQDPEVVVLLNEEEEDGENLLAVNISKNKGRMGTKRYKFNPETGKLGEVYQTIDDRFEQHNSKEVEGSTNTKTNGTLKYPKED